VRIPALASWLIAVALGLLVGSGLGHPSLGWLVAGVTGAILAALKARPAPVRELAHD
jgi:hypothetical protein